MEAVIEHALDKARVALKLGEIPVGAAVLRNGVVVASAHNMTLTNKDQAAHAELLALRAAANVLGGAYLTDCDIYVTLEPCPMCAYAISLFRIKRLYFGVYNPKDGGVFHGPRVLHSSSCHHQPEIYCGFNQEDCSSLLRQFFEYKRLQNSCLGSYKAPPDV